VAALAGALKHLKKLCSLNSFPEFMLSLLALFLFVMQRDSWTMKNVRLGFLSANMEKGRM
jgi:hypothetical protein